MTFVIKVWHIQKWISIIYLTIVTIMKLLVIAHFRDI